MAVWIFVLTASHVRQWQKEVFRRFYGHPGIYEDQCRRDGFSLDQKRTEVAENDIPDIIARWRNLPEEENRTRKDKSFFVPVEEIRENDYVLSMNKYREVEREAVEYVKPEVILGRIDNLETEISAAFAEFRAKFL